MAGSKLVLRTEVVSLHSYQANPIDSNSVVGPLYFEIDDFAFPSKGWIDRALSVIGWWIYPLKTLLLGQSEEVALTFGEGSFEIIVRHVAANEVELRFMRGIGDDGEELFKTTVSVSDLLSELARVAGELEESLQEKGWSNLTAYAAEVRRLGLLLPG